MTISTVTSTHANTVAPFVSLGRQPVGQESADLKNSTFKPLEQPAESARGENGRGSDQNIPLNTTNSPDSPDRRVQERDGQADQQSSKKDQQLKEQALKDQKQISELSAVDREVRAHEMAHAAAGGRYAGSPTYSFVKGPDGVNYAVGGEVSIDTSAVPNDPEATLRKAEQIRQAANAPADPSPQDRRVAADAASLEAQARAELQVRDAKAQAEQATAPQKKSDTSPDSVATNNNASAIDAVAQADSARKEAAQKDASQKAAKAESEKADQDWEKRRQEGLDILIGVSKKAINLNRHLVEIGAVKGSSTAGSLLNEKV